MMLYVHPTHITPEHVHMLMEVNKLASDFERPNLLALAKQINTGSAVMFEIPHGIVVVEILESNGERRLNMMSFYCSKFGAHGRGITEDLQRLARDWNCARVTTVIWDKRLARQLEKLGCKTEYTSLILESGLAVAQETPDEHQDEVHPEDEHDEHLSAAELDAAGTGGFGEQSDGGGRPTADVNLSG